MVPPPSHNTVGVCNRITLLILCYVSSRLVTLLKVIDAPIQVPNIFDLTVIFKFLSCSFQICLLFVPEMSASFTSYIVQIIDIALLGSRTHCILACFLWSKKCKHSSYNHTLWCFNSCRPRLSLAEILIPSLLFSQALFMSSLSLKFSKAANLFEISTWYRFLTSAHLDSWD